MKKTKKQIMELIYTAIIMAIGLILLKVVPMQIYGGDIPFDASSHVVWAVFVLYVVYFFIDQNKSWRIPYFIFAAAILAIIAIQRIIIGAHNEIGVMLGIVISIIAIIIPRWKEVHKKLKF
jgi:membrane-associated phospholipid phosphatase